MDTWNIPRGIQMNDSVRLLTIRKIAIRFDGIDSALVCERDLSGLKRVFQSGKYASSQSAIFGSRD